MASTEVQSSKSSMCRVCMENRPEMVHIFSQLEEAFIANIITECTAVQIVEDDGLPNCVCSACVEDLKYFIQFIKKTRASDHRLRKMFKKEIKLEHVELKPLPAITSVETGTHDVDIKLEPMQEIKEEPGSDAEIYVEFEDANDSDYVYKTSSEEEYEEPKRRRSTTVKSSPGKGRRGRKRKTKDDDEPDGSNSFEELDEIEQKTFTEIDVEDRSICCSCFKLFDTVEELKEHGKKNHESTRRLNKAKNHICEFCFRRYCTAEALKVHHKKVKFIKKVYDCILCDVRFSASAKRRNHAHQHPTMVPKSAVIIAAIPVKEQQDMGKICCAQGCNRTYETEEQLLEHSINAHKANKVQSILTGSEQRPVECPICYKRFMDEAGLKMHQQRVYTPKRHVCSICGLKFSHAAECNRHEREHRDEKVFKCEQCPKSYFSMDRLKAHIKRHTASREFMCNICGQSYMQKHNLQAHMLMHEGKLPFECEVCKKAFRVKAKMIYHMRVHSGEKPYPCRYCDMAFADSTNRLRHEMSHTGIKPYKCDYCEKTFITKRLKKEHESTHSGKKPYRCNVCFVSFNQSSALKYHQLEHIEASQDGSISPL